MASRLVTLETEKIVEDNTEAVKRYLQDTDSDDNGVVKPVKRVVKPMKDKIFEKMTNTIGQMKDAMKIHDCARLQESFDKTNKQLEKFMRVADSVPNMYIKALIMLDEFVNRSLANKELRWKRTRVNAKALNVMKHKLKKINRQYEELVNIYKENPEVSEEEDWEIVEDCMDLDCDWDDDEDECKTGSEWENIMSGKAKLVENELVRGSSKLTWDMVTRGFKEIVAEKQEKKKGAGRIKLLEQGKKGLGKICVEPNEQFTRVHILSPDVNYSYIFYHQ